MADDYTLTPVEHDPWAEAQTHRAELPNPAAPIVNFGKLFAKTMADRAVSAITAPRDALFGTMQVTDPETGMPTREAMERGQSVANLAMTGGIPFARQGAAGIFGGRLAKTADQAALAKAEEMAKAGAHPTDVWNETGWFKGADDKWRFEIPDEKSAMKAVASPPHRLELAQQYFEEMGVPRIKFATGQFPDVQAKALKMADEAIAARSDHQPLSTFVEHPELYAAYPKVGDIPTLKQQSFGYKGSFLPGEDPHMSFADTINAGPRAQHDTLSTILHESQHAVQDAEGFARGANTFGLKPKTPAWDIYQERLKAMTTPLSHEDFSKQAGYDGLAPQKEYKDYLKTVKKPSPMADRAAQEYAVQEAYRRHAGEVEARNVQSRMNMSPEERRASPPWTTEDTPREQQIVRMGGNGPQMSLSDKLAPYMTPPEPPGITGYHGSPHDYSATPVDHDPFQ